MDGEGTSKLSLAKDDPKLSKSDLHYMKQIEKLNLERVLRLRSIKRNNFIISGCLGIGVLSIYFYTIHAVRQEKFLDDFDVPQTTAE